MRVLGIETSCDDTGVGIVTLKNKKITVEVNVTASQVLIHRKYGGVVPEVAAREHALTILPTLQAALKKEKTGWKNIDAVAVTAGPGLNTALLVGVETARVLAYVHKKPLVRVNHIEGHIVSAFASPAASKIRFPAVALIVSGGHTELLHVQNIGQYKLLGATIDDAVGEAFDKTGKMLGLPYPGGPEVARLATRGNAAAFAFPRALMQPGNLDFSYAGLKTSVLYFLRDHPRYKKQRLADVCASFQAAAIDPLIEKTRQALEHTGAKTLLLGGGVAANTVLRSRLEQMVARFPKVAFIPPVLPLCTDNGAMTAIAGALRARRKDFTSWQKIKADPNWELV